MQKAFPLLPSGLLHKYIRIKRIKINQKRAQPAQKLCEGDFLQLYINDDLLTRPPEDDFMSAPSQIEVLYEDENILLVNKPAGLSVHEDETGTSDTLINRIKHYLYEKGAFIPEQEASFVPSLCNRIDRNTSGIVIAAKTAATLRVLNEKIKNREVTKLYKCLVHGEMPAREETLTSYLEKDETQKRVFVSDRKTPQNKTAITQYRVLGVRDGISLLEINLKTGRTHQIRAQLAHIGRPLAGDGKYGTLKNPLGLKHQALCSCKLVFDFKTDAGPLNYLKNKAFEITNIDFEEKWRLL